MLAIFLLIYLICYKLHALYAIHKLCVRIGKFLSSLLFWQTFRTGTTFTVFWLFRIIIVLVIRIASRRTIFIFSFIWACALL